MTRGWSTIGTYYLHSPTPADGSQRKMSRRCNSTNSFWTKNRTKQNYIVKGINMRGDLPGFVPYCRTQQYFETLRMFRNLILESMFPIHTRDGKSTSDLRSIRLAAVKKLLIISMMKIILVAEER